MSCCSNCKESDCELFFSYKSIEEKKHDNIKDILICKKCINDITQKKKLYHSAVPGCCDICGKYDREKYIPNDDNYFILEGSGYPNGKIFENYDACGDCCNKYVYIKFDSDIDYDEFFDDYQAYLYDCEIFISDNITIISFKYLYDFYIKHYKKIEEEL